MEDNAKSRPAPHIASPTQSNFHFPGPPPTLQPSFNPSISAHNSSSNTLPPISSSLFPREPPASRYYDPTQDSADRSRYQDITYPQPPPYRSPIATKFTSNSTATPIPSNPYTPSRSDNVPNSPHSPPVYSIMTPHQQPSQQSSQQSSQQQQQQQQAPQPYASPVRPMSRDTPSRKADVMSLSNLMSDDAPTYTKHQPASYSSEAAVPNPPFTPSAPPPADVAPPPPPSPPAATPQTVIPTKSTSTSQNNSYSQPVQPEQNGHATPSQPQKARPDSAKVTVEYNKLDASLPIENLENIDVWTTEYKDESAKRIVAINHVDEEKRKRRRIYHTRRYIEIFEGNAAHGKAEYFQNNEPKAWREVQAAEALEEKERKKDMQRKRRRERAFKNEAEKLEEAIERLDSATGVDRERYRKEVERHEKKMRHTARLLGSTDPKDLREVTPQDINMSGGVMGLIQMSDDGKKPSKNRMSTRPRKSKDQRQAEKDRAAAAQEALDNEQDAPAPTPKTPSQEVTRTNEKEEEVDLREKNSQRYTSKAYTQLFDSIWKEMAKKDVGKVLRIKNESFNTKTSNLRKTAQLAGKEARRFQLRTNKNTKDVQARAKRSMREMLSFWKRNERDERDQRKLAEKQEIENAKRLEAEREASRQKRKLNFLLSQTELYSHFIEKKVGTSALENASNGIDAAAPPVQAAGHTNKALPDIPDKVGAKVTNFEDLDFDDEDETNLQNAAMANAHNALMEAQERTKAFKDDDQSDYDGELNFQNPTSLGNLDIEQPKLLSCQLKEYQLKGLNWLVNLYEQGINGILADEMGLGKTVQSISVMAYLAEHHNIWGPFLVIAPASTLHNWQQEISKFVPDMKALPYWGTAKDRKVLRRFWDRKKITYRKDAPFHVLITSYQLVVQDTQYFQRMTWQYMILDEAQAIKSSNSSRWKSLLGFHCRNRLLLTGTPIQNNMQELWALLHFIMPTLFDSHDEFSEWFSKDIESHAQSNTKLNEDQLKRLHMILKPFMLRRIKKHVQKELGDKVELDLYCDLTYRQRAYYSSLRNKISLMDLIEKATLGDDQDTATLMNLVMQFRKVCNHPDLFERADTSSPFAFSYWAETASFLREGNFVNVAYSSRNIIEYKVPRLVYSKERLDIAGPTNENVGMRSKILNHMMNVFTTDNVNQSEKENGAFAWLRFTDVSAGQVSKIAKQDVASRAIDLRQQNRNISLFNVIYEDPQEYEPVSSMFNIVNRNDRIPLSEVGSGHLKNLLNVYSNSFEQSGIGTVEPCAAPKTSALPIALDCSSQRANSETRDSLFNIPIRSALYNVTPAFEEQIITRSAPTTLIPRTIQMLPEPVQTKSRFNHITVPSMRRFVSDCGKLLRLDSLLKELKENGHRVLLYFQMTRMIDMMEEYLTYRNYKYCRLDGSTKLEDRRDTVADFQSKPEIFIFLLSTRAGGLGINLTSADTVIFYDSDWNPTIDSQAMDRAHRLGQTKQVTVYRMITRGTIEERIRKRALQKEEVQRVVISGQTSSSAGAVVDFNSRSRENRTKDIALWLADDEQAEEIERREQEAIAKGESGTGKGRRKKKAAGAGTMEDMYHEGEGHFEDSAKPSGAATPIDNGEAPGSKKKKGISKKAKTMKQRLAIADGEVNV